MTGRHNTPPGSGRRWWEIRGRFGSDAGGYGDVAKSGRGRSRAERLLSVGADPADDSTSALRRLLLPIASVVAAVLLIPGVVYFVSTSKSEPLDATSPDVVTGDAATESSVNNLPPVDVEALPPLGGSGDTPRPPADIPRPPADPPRAPADTPKDEQGDASGDRPEGKGGNDAGNADDQPTRPPTSSAPPTSSTTPTSTVPPTSSSPTPPPGSIKLEGPAPGAPAAQQGGPPVPGEGGCTGISNTSKYDNYYACTVTLTAPAYLPGTTDPRGALSPNQYPFLCQADGSKYSVEDRANHWWGWVGYGNAGMWVPVLFLDGGTNDGPEPGLPVCGSAPTTTTTPSAEPTSEPSETATEPSTETTSEPSETTSEPSTESTSEPSVEATSEPSETATEPSTEPTSEPSVEATSEPSETATEPSTTSSQPNRRYSGER